MAIPKLTPSSTKSAIVLPATGSTSKVADALPLGAYSGSVQFITGATAQVAYTYKKLGGDVLDLELTEQNVYANYEEAVLEYSYLINIHQSKNTLGGMLGAQTASFDHRGEAISGPNNVALKYPKFSFETAFRIADAYSTEALVGGRTRIYSASVDRVVDKQDYNLQNIISSSAATETEKEYYNKVKGKRVRIHQVYYVTPRQMWRFYGYYGGLNVVGDFHNYGQYADDSTFQVIPAWQNKIQAIQYEDHLYTRTSHYSYEVIDNNLRLFPTPDSVSPEKFWVRFSIENEKNPWEDDFDSGQNGINNINTVPFENLPYENINSIGKQWIRRFSLALSKETLGHIRSKFGDSIPIPGESVNLNGKDLISQGTQEQKDLRDELKTQLDELTYPKLLEMDAKMSEDAQKMVENVPMKIFVG